MTRQKFEVGNEYRMLARRREGWFWATCVSRTEKTATFEANESGSAWYRPRFTLRMQKKGAKNALDCPNDEIMLTNVGSNHFPYGLMAFASENRTKKKENAHE